MTLTNYLNSQKADSELIIELYIEGISIDDICEKFEMSRHRVLVRLRPYMPTSEELEKFKRKIAKRNLKQAKGNL